MSSRQILMAALASLSLLAPRLASAAEVKIAYVDMQRALAEVDEGKAARAKLEAMQEAKQKEIDKEQVALKNEKDTYDKQQATMTEAARSQQQQDLGRKIQELQQRFEKGRTELAQAERESFAAIYGKMQPLIATIAQRDGFTVVLEKSAVMYAPGSLDVTNELIRVFNEKNKVAATPGASSSKKATPKDAPTATGK